MTTGTLSHAIAAVAFLVLTLLLVASRQGGRHGALLILACSLSLAWALAGLIDPLSRADADAVKGLPDTLRILGWGLFVHSLIELGRRSGSGGRAVAGPESAAREADGGSTVELDTATRAVSEPRPRSRTEGLRFPLFALLLLLAQTLLPMAAASGFIDPETLSTAMPSLWIGAAICVLVLLEELYRNTLPERRYAIRHLCIGLGVMLAFDFFVFTDALLFRRVSVELWNARGLLAIVVVPLIALSVARNRDWALRLHVSREAATGSAVVLVAGAYLLATALAGSLIRYSGASWAGVAETALLVLAAAMLTTLALSRRLRAQARVLVSKHLFSYKYDYRREWLKFTDTLARDADDAPAAILKGLTSIVESEAGALWGKDSGDRYELLVTRGLSGLERIAPSQLRSLERFLLRTRWLVDLDEWREHPERYEGLELPAAIGNNNVNWLIVPLPFNDDIIGLVLIARSIIMKRVNWEDRDLLKTAGHQAAGLLAQRRDQQALADARQFEGFSRLSAYIVHDLKNILGQQSLIVSNAAKHKHKPEFIDDTIATIENSVARMNSLLEQLRTERHDERAAPLDLARLLREAMRTASVRRPVPTAAKTISGVLVRANREKLVRVFGHLLQNAQEATTPEGHVEVSIERVGESVRVRIADDGHGMSERFLRERLFRPFESTKGLTGMGIGAHESREYVRSIGGEIEAESELERGTIVTVELPLEPAARANGAAAPRHDPRAAAVRATGSDANR